MNKDEWTSPSSPRGQGERGDAMVSGWQASCGSTSAHDCPDGGRARALLRIHPQRAAGQTLSRHGATSLCFLGTLSPWEAPAGGCCSSPAPAPPTMPCVFSLGLGLGAFPGRRWAGVGPGAAFLSWSGLFLSLWHQTDSSGRTSLCSGLLMVQASPFQRSSARRGLSCLPAPHTSHCGPLSARSPHSRAQNSGGGWGAAISLAVKAPILTGSCGVTSGSGPSSVFPSCYRASLVAQTVKNPPAMQETQVQDQGSIPGLGRSPGGGHDNPLQCSCLENPHGQRSLVVAKSRIQLSDWAAHILLFWIILWGEPREKAPITFLLVGGGSPLTYPVVYRTVSRGGRRPETSSGIRWSREGPGVGALHSQWLWARQDEITHMSLVSARGCSWGTISISSNPQNNLAGLGGGFPLYRWGNQGSEVSHYLPQPQGSERPVSEQICGPQSPRLLCSTRLSPSSKLGVSYKDLLLKRGPQAFVRLQSFK